nr:MAG TPA: hypothetical protein [Caudoviricetes sp.]
MISVVFFVVLTNLTDFFPSHNATDTISSQTVGSLELLNSSNCCRTVLPILSNTKARLKHNDCSLICITLRSRRHRRHEVLDVIVLCTRTAKPLTRRRACVNMDNLLRRLTMVHTNTTEANFLCKHTELNTCHALNPNISRHTFRMETLTRTSNCLIVSRRTIARIDIDGFTAEETPKSLKALNQFIVNKDGLAHAVIFTCKFMQCKMT